MNELILDGKKYDLSPELVEKIKAEVTEQEKVENPFERKVDKLYYFVDAAGGVFSFTDYESETADSLYSVGNYCRDKSIMEQRALHETLNRLLWRYSEIHGGDGPWDGKYIHYSIYWDGNGFIVSWNKWLKYNNSVYFTDMSTAESAIAEVIKPFMKEHPEFVW